MRRPGIEPGSPAWKAEILPLDQRRNIIKKHDLKYSISYNFSDFIVF